VKQAQAHYRTGEAAFNAGRFEEAIAEWERGYALAPKPLFVVNLAHAERRRGELRKSLALYRRYLLVDPETELRGEVERVIAELERAIAADDEARAPRTPPRPPAPAPRAEAAAPALVTPAAPPPDRAPSPLYKRWWVWTAAAAVVGGAAAGAWLLR
jgi:tetratricopeptide (TPR) repeat protein